MQMLNPNPNPNAQCKSKCSIQMRMLNPNANAQSNRKCSMQTQILNPMHMLNPNPKSKRKYSIQTQTLNPNANAQSKCKCWMLMLYCQFKHHLHLHLLFTIVCWSMYFFDWLSILSLYHSTNKKSNPTPTGLELSCRPNAHPNAQSKFKCSIQIQMLSPNANAQSKCKCSIQMQMLYPNANALSKFKRSIQMQMLYPNANAQPKCKCSTQMQMLYPNAYAQCKLSILSITQPIKSKSHPDRFGIVVPSKRASTAPVLARYLEEKGFQPLDSLYFMLPDHARGQLGNQRQDLWKTSGVAWVQ